MEATRAEKARLGVFLVTLAAVLVVLVLFLIGGRLFTRTNDYFTRMEESITGLGPGSTVRQNGVDVGQVTFITADSTNIRRTIVHFNVRRGTHIKADMTATLGSYGITGLKYLEISGGSYGSANVPDGGEVKSSLSMIGRLTTRADSIAYKIDRLLGNVIAITEMDNRENLNRMMAASAGLAESLDSMARDIQGVRPGRRIATLLDQADLTMRSARTKVDKSDVDGMIREYKKAAQDIQKVAGTLDVTVRRTQEDLAVSMSNLRESLKNMQSFTRQLRENPSVLLRREEKQERRE
jgi:phospholipid/cholesterol/gamma-HCH transport system substrate-binding protein